MKLNLSKRTSAFTMVEIALCLAIVGFALVAIIGVLPTGMNVQRDNRHQTIINQDAAVWLDALRSGARGYGDLTNYVESITVYWTQYRVTDDDITVIAGPGQNTYTRTTSKVGLPALDDNSSPLTNATRIVGLLSTPKYWPSWGPNRLGDFTSNYVVAVVRSMSGAAVEKSPQQNQDVLDAAFAYRMVVEAAPYVPTEYNTNNPAMVHLRNIQMVNATDLRLLFRWPVLPNGIGNGRQTYRQLISGSIGQYVDPTGQPVYFHQSSTMVQLP